MSWCCMVWCDLIEIQSRSCRQAVHFAFQCCFVGLHGRAHTPTPKHVCVCVCACTCVRVHRPDYQYATDRCIHIQRVGARAAPPRGFEFPDTPKSPLEAEPVDGDSADEDTTLQAAAAGMALAQDAGEDEESAAAAAAAVAVAAQASEEDAGGGGSDDEDGEEAQEDVRAGYEYDVTVRGL